MSKESTITVAVRVRPLSSSEAARLEVRDEANSGFLGDGALAGESSRIPKYSAKNANCGIRKVLNVVDDRMLVFDPPESTFLSEKDSNVVVRRGPDKMLRTSNTRQRERKFVFDRLFDEDADQEEVFNNTTRPLLDSVLDGFNATVFAYGATGCGKTHTIIGNPEEPGIIFLTMAELFRKMEERKDNQIIEMTLSYLEIYNETIRDLLNPNANEKRLILREDKRNHITVANLTSHKPESVEEVMEMILQGNKNRTVSPTEANATSSRSHAVLQINITQRSRSADINEEHTFATLSIIDLAGSERAAVSKNRGERFQEGANINKSLLALGNCINALCEPHKACHVPYRNSKLTRLLKFSLGGNCKTVMIVCVSPSSQHYDETLNTLKYANRAKDIRTKLARNQHNVSRHVGSYLRMIEEQRKEITALKERETQLVDTALHREREAQAKCQSQLSKSLDELKGSIANLSQAKMQKASLLARRRNLYTDKICLLKLEDLLDNENTRDIVAQLLDDVESKIAEVEQKCSHESELDTVLQKSSKLMLRKLQELDGWTGFYTNIYNASVSLLKEYVDREIMTLASIAEDETSSQIQMFPLLAECVVTAGIPLDDSLEKLGKQSFQFSYSTIPSPNGNRPSSRSQIVPKNKRDSLRNRRYSASPITKATRKTILKGLRSPKSGTKLKKTVRWEIPPTSSELAEEISNEDVSMDSISAASPIVLRSKDEKIEMEFSPKPEERSSPLSGRRKIVPLTARTIKPSLTSQRLFPTLPGKFSPANVSSPVDVVMKDGSTEITQTTEEASSLA